MSFHFKTLEIPGLVLVETTVREDPRGHFLESFKASAFKDGGIEATFVQDNFARSTRGVLRGLHFQLPPHPQGKLVSVTRGTVWDVAVDLRKGSPTYLQWLGVELSGGTGRILYIPPGFAHGYLVLSAQADFAYKVTAEYSPDLDSGVRWNDPEIGVDWPVSDPVLSPKDLELPLLKERTLPFRYGDEGGGAADSRGGDHQGLERTVE